ncbi:MAG: MlaD family protein [Acidobacteriota bacterium]
MKTDGYKTTAVGLVITLSLILGAMAILTVGREQGFFRDEVLFYTDFPNVDGLSVGAPVRLIGVQVGVVKRITLSGDAAKQDVEVVLAVDRAYRDRIRRGSTASLKSLTYLSGEKYVQLTPGDASRSVLEEGGYIESPRSDVEQFIAQSQTIAENIETISSQVSELLAHVNRGESILSQLLEDPNFGRQTLDDASQAISRINHIAERLENGEGIAGRLLGEDARAESILTDFSAVLTRIDRLTRRVEEGEGFLGQLAAPESDLLKAQDEFRDLVASLKGLVEGIKAGQGLAGRVLTDEEFGRRVTGRVETLTADLGEIVRKIDQGEGTLGRMINEPELYDQATDVIGGLSDRRFLKWVARRVRNKEVKARIEEYVQELEKAEKAAEKNGP